MEGGGACGGLKGSADVDLIGAAISSRHWVLWLPLARDRHLPVLG